MQGDVLGVYNESGTLLVSYIYDAWGNFTETVNSTSTEATLASDLPFRYRGYYFDEEIGLYYLNTRYYDASIGRFINVDDISYLGANGDLEGFNLYAYCSNNPVMGVDPNGESIIDFWKNRFKNFFSSIEAEIGVGWGLWADLGENDASLEAYRDATIFLDDGKLLAGNAVAFRVRLLKFGFGGKHTQYTDGNHEDVHTHGMSNTMIEDSRDIINCEKCKHDMGVSYKNGSINGSDVVIETGGSIHVGVGGHVNIGFNLSKFIKRSLFDLLR